MADPEDPEDRPDAPPANSRAPTVARPTVSSDALTTASGDEEWRVGAYQLLSRIGTGGMGDVFLAVDVRLERHVAIKRPHFEARMDPQARERLRREAMLAARINHPAVVQIHDIVVEPAGDAIVMEYVDGHTLADMIGDGPLTVEQAVVTARQVAEGLAAAHAQDLVHRDLKTENVKVTRDGQAKILDFGLAKRLTPRPDEAKLTRDGARPGTRRAMSPEQVEGRPLDARSDLFSLGVLLYEVCTRHSPFLGDGEAGTLQKVLSFPPRPVRELNPALPPSLDALITQLLEKEPARRPASAAAVAERLRKIERELLLRPWLRRAAVGVLALAALLGIWHIWLGLTPPRPIAVLVQGPEAASPPVDERSALAAFAVREAIVRTLADLEGIEPVGHDELPGGALTPQAAARAVAADELVIPTMTCQGARCRVSLRRQRASDARIVTDTGSFDVPSEPEDSLALTRAVEIQVGQAFREHRFRPGRELADVRAADYQRYLLLRRRIEAGGRLGRAEIDELEQIARSSPGLTEAHILGAGAARGLPDRARATFFLQAGESRHPGDPRLAYERFLLEEATGSLSDAEAALAELEKRAPGDVLVWRARGRLLSRQGKYEEAAQVQRRLVRERPSWWNLWHVADVEIDLADAAGARRHLEQLLAVSPGNALGLAKMAELEWQMGDPRHAAGIYESLLKDRVTQESLGGLGWSLLLAGDYAASANAYRRALERDPDDVLSRLNLGIADEGSGDAAGAQEAFRDVLARLAPREARGELTVNERLLKAQALARLGDPVPAVTHTIQALAGGNRDAQVIFQAAIIYALCGEHNHAIVLAKEARPRLSPRWFAIPGFEALHDLPAFRELLAPAAGRAARDSARSG